MVYTGYNMDLLYVISEIKRKRWRNYAQQSLLMNRHTRYMHMLIRN